MKKIIKNYSFLLAFFFLLGYICNYYNINLITTEVLAMDNATLEKKLAGSITQGFTSSGLHFQEDFTHDSGVRGMFRFLMETFAKFKKGQFILEELCRQAKQNGVKQDRIQFLKDFAATEYNLKSASEDVEIMTNSNSSHKSK